MLWWAALRALLRVVLSNTAFGSYFKSYCQDYTPYRGSGMPPRCVWYMCCATCHGLCVVCTIQTRGSFCVLHSDGGGAEKTLSDDLISNALSEVSLLPDTNMSEESADAESKRCQQLLCSTTVSRGTIDTSCRRFVLNGLIQHWLCLTFLESCLKPTFFIPVLTSGFIR